jgi:PucR C-terminal helix-turn-helix domain/GGDEF-like domain
MATDVQTEGVRFQALFARVASDPAWIRRVSEEITEAIHRELAGEADDDELRAGTLASTRSVLTLMADMVRLGRPASEGVPPPDAIAYAREFVHRGLPVDALLRAYHVGHATFFDNWVAGVHEEVTDPQWLARAVELVANWTFEYVQALNRELVTRFTAERERWVRSAAAIRTDTVRALLDGEPFDQHLATQRLSYQLDRHHLAYVIWSEEDDDGDPYATLEDVASDLAREAGAGRPLVVGLAPRLVCAWVGAPEPFDMVVARVAGAPRVAFGSTAEGVQGFRSSHREAMQARRVARLSGRRGGTVTRYVDVALTAVASVDLDLARDFVARELGPLAGNDDDSLRLAATLRVYLEEHASPRRTAQRLGVHENTVKNRVRAARELLGHPPEERVAEVLVALRLARLTRDRNATT